MNISQPSGESSSKGEENGDNTTEIERPLKKARFAWQVKGKYHLKDESNNKKSYPNTESPPQDTLFPTSSDHEIETCTMGEEHFDAIEDFILNTKLSKLDPVPDTENSNVENCSESEVRVPFQNYPPMGLPYHVDDINVLNHSSSSSIDENTLVPMSMVHKVSSWVEDQCINRWQYLQITKACLDNSMNQILESWLMPMLDSPDEGNRFYNIVEFIENLPRRNRVENEGILMAISAHGLQNNSQSNIDSESNLNSLQVNPSPSTSPLVFEDNTVEDVRAEKNCFWDNLNEASLFPDSIIRNEHEEKNLENVSKMDSVMTPDSSPESSKILSSDQQEEDSIDMSKYYKEYGNMSMYSEGLCSDQCDFMDAAVSFAIQSKGLTSYGTDYG